jgi:hypothetical protein
LRGAATLVPRLLAATPPEYTASLKLSGKKTSVDIWHDVGAALTAAAPRLPPSFRIEIVHAEAPWLNFERDGGPSPLLTALRLLSPYLQRVELVLPVVGHGMCECKFDDMLLLLFRPRGPRTLAAWMREAVSPPEGLLHAGNAFAPVLRALQVPLVADTPDTLLSDVPVLRDHLEELQLKLRKGGADMRMSPGVALGLRRLRVHNIHACRHVPSVAIDAGLAQLSSLTRLALRAASVLRSVTLEDPEGWLDRPRAQLFPALEEADLQLGTLPPPSLARLLSALHHVTKLHVSLNRKLETWCEGLTALTRLRDLHTHVCGMLPLPLLEAVDTWRCFPATLQRLWIGSRADVQHFVTILPSISRLTSLASLTIDGGLLSLRVDPLDGVQLPALREISVSAQHLIHTRSELAGLLRCCDRVGHFRVTDDHNGVDLYHASTRDEVQTLVQKLEEAEEKRRR